MINIEDHIVEIEGKEYVPADIAIEAVIQAVNAEKNLVSALSEFKSALKDLNDDFKDADLDD